MTTTTGLIIVGGAALAAAFAALFRMHRRRTRQGLRQICQGVVQTEERPGFGRSCFAAFRENEYLGKVDVKRVYFPSVDADARAYAELYISEVADKLNEEP